MGISKKYCKWSEMQYFAILSIHPLIPFVLLHFRLRIVFLFTLYCNRVHSAVLKRWRKNKEKAKKKKKQNRDRKRNVCMERWKMSVKKCCFEKESRYSIRMEIYKWFNVSKIKWNKSTSFQVNFLYFSLRWIFNENISWIFFISFHFAFNLKLKIAINYIEEKEKFCKN